ncbi:MAG: twin-arginine translocation signal domain-containing protein [Candidatus Rokubacteria bacterium]|nr:twin-arginine translocation signal domain-containing protein [Candidatus Rokubacteria bacterium]
MLDRRSLLKLGAAGAAALGTGIHLAHAQEKPKRGGTLTIGRNHDADTLYPGPQVPSDSRHLQAHGRVGRVRRCPP